MLCKQQTTYKIPPFSLQLFMAEYSAAVIGGGFALAAAGYQIGAGFTARHETVHAQQLAEMKRHISEFEEAYKREEVSKADWNHFLEIRDLMEKKESEYDDSIESYKSTPMYKFIRKWTQKSAVRKKKAEVRKINKVMREHYYESTSGSSDASSTTAESGSPTRPQKMYSNKDEELINKWARGVANESDSELNSEKQSDAENRCSDKSSSETDDDTNMFFHNKRLHIGFVVEYAAFRIIATYHAWPDLNRSAFRLCTVFMQSFRELEQKNGNNKTYEKILTRVIECNRGLRRLAELAVMRDIPKMRTVVEEKAYDHLAIFQLGPHGEQRVKRASALTLNHAYIYPGSWSSHEFDEPIWTINNSENIYLNPCIAVVIHSAFILDLEDHGYISKTVNDFSSTQESRDFPASLIALAATGIYAALSNAALGIGGSKSRAVAIQERKRKLYLVYEHHLKILRNVKKTDLKKYRTIMSKMYKDVRSLECQNAAHKERQAHGDTRLRQEVNMEMQAGTLGAESKR